jgi:hypothetical protein
MISILISILISLVVFDIRSEALYTTSAGCVGAVYTMSNGAMMNQVFIYCLNSTGQLTWMSAVNTNGTGVNTTNTDPLFSQGSMMVYSNFLFVVNAGSNSLSMFMMNSADATQLTLISVQATNGLFPISVTVNANYACVLTGGSQTGIRCFTYNSSGLFLMSSFDRNITLSTPQTTPPNGPAGTLSEILFSADGQSLIISVKGYNASSRGYLLFYPLMNNSAMLSMNPTMQTPPSGILPFSMTLVGTNGLLITDPGSQGVLTQTYSSITGTITNSVFTSINTSIAGALCWSTYSPMTGDYYVIGASSATIVELMVNLSSTANPVTLVQYYSLPNNAGTLEATVVTLGTTDYLYILGTTAQVISSYRLNGPGNATYNGFIAVQSANMTGIPKIAGIAAYLQTRASSSSSADLFQKSTIIFWSFAIAFYFYST